MKKDNNHKILVTGAAGFIGFHLCKKLLNKENQVIGIDNLNPYYDVSLKHARLDLLKPHKNFIFYKEDIQNLSGLKEIFENHAIGRICNLAAQAGVRYSLEDPFSYQKSNLEGFLNLLEMARKYTVVNFVYASSSSVYGHNKKIPFSVDDRVDTPASFYGATKKANELMAYAYSHLYQIPSTGLRYFTVYGPWGRHKCLQLRSYEKGFHLHRRHRGRDHSRIGKPFSL
jgi:UDP-glucuronate 4-epimerase